MRLTLVFSTLAVMFASCHYDDYALFFAATGGNAGERTGSRAADAAADSRAGAAGSGEGGKGGTESAPADALESDLPCSPDQTLATEKLYLFETTGPVCIRIAKQPSGWGCDNIDGRTVRVNDGPSETRCGGALPDAWSDGYWYFSFTEGDHKYATFWWN